MEIKFIKYNGIKEYSKVMYNDVKDADKYTIEVAYSGKDIKALLEYLFELEQRIDKAIEYIKEMPDEEEYNGLLYDNEEKRDLLEILGDKE